MLVTALAPKIGYERAAAIAKAAHANGTTLREEAVRPGYVSPAEFDRLVRPEKMVHPG
jgi:fumarate hydratase class II